MHNFTNNKRDANFWNQVPFFIYQNLQKLKKEKKKKDYPVLASMQCKGYSYVLLMGRQIDTAFREIIWWCISSIFLLNYPKKLSKIYTKSYLQIFSVIYEAEKNRNILGTKKWNWFNTFQFIPTVEH